MDLLPTIAAHAKMHGIEPLKSLGQNFLFNPSICEKIAKSSKIEPQDIVLEIGPGTAGLTRAILDLGPEKVIVAEKDYRCINLLNEIREFYPQLNILEKDALTLKLENLFEIFSIKDKKIKIVANLPYNIATPLIISWMKETQYIKSIHVMVQKEVAERISSNKSTKSYGRLSVITQAMCDTKKLFDVSPEAFFPKPKIWSSIIELIPRANPPSADLISRLEIVTLNAFGMRRKMLRSSLKALNITDKLEKFDLSKRAEDLSVDEFIEIAKLLS